MTEQNNELEAATAVTEIKSAPKEPSIKRRRSSVPKVSVTVKRAHKGAGTQLSLKAWALKHAVKDLQSAPAGTHAATILAWRKNKKLEATRH